VFARFLDKAPPDRNLDRITWPPADTTGRQLGALDGIDNGTDGSQSAVEQARTALENANAYPTLGVPHTLGELSTMQNSVNNAYQQLANVVILTSLPIAGCTLAAAIAAGLADRKRPFSLLRLTGARLSLLRRVVALESAVPLLAVAAVAIGVGFSASAMFASVQLQHPLVAPGADYYFLTAAGIAAALGIIAATFPLLRRITGPEAARND
jgi:predicted lysophospholipase L1 biosynthesis ABC-type transport system permease subunit